ncbi:Uncharacterised protein [Streptococcus pneumoniae]|uniref:Uncharacterized protein n=1 Tax=Streptococcus pneumoniae TaxID=1313 RepID=A0A4M9XVV9_STREE|nr:Uncharacterised protein [Streptococcus pneumoniae]
MVFRLGVNNWGYKEKNIVKTTKNILTTLSVSGIFNL